MRLVKKLMIGLKNRFTHTAMYVKKFISDENLGDIYFAQYGWLLRNGMAPIRWFTGKSLSGGGSLIDLCVHILDLVLYFMDYPSPVSANAKTYRKFGGIELDQLCTYPFLHVNPVLKHSVGESCGRLYRLSNEAVLYDENELTHFVNCIRNDSEPSISILFQSVEMMKILEAIYKHAETRRQVTF